MGKTVPDAFAEVGRGIESVEAAIAAPHLLKGEVLEGVSRGIDVESFNQPVGVVGGDHAVQLPRHGAALVHPVRASPAATRSC